MRLKSVNMLDYCVYKVFFDSLLSSAGLDGTERFLVRCISMSSCAVSGSSASQSNGLNGFHFLDGTDFLMNVWRRGIWTCDIASTYCLEVSGRNLDDSHRDFFVIKHDTVLCT